MNAQLPSDPSAPVYRELDKHISEIRTLINQLDPSERLRFVNEMMMRLLPNRNQNNGNAQEKLHKKHVNPLNTLSEEEQALIKEMAKQTNNLYRAMNEDDGN